MIEESSFLIQVCTQGHPNSIQHHLRHLAYTTYLQLPESIAVGNG